ncbi:GDSL esterase/lipase At5g55050 [Linum perenne]
MGSSTTTVLILFLVSSAGVLIKAADGQPVPAVYVFGDSLVDVGNNNYLRVSLAKADFPHNGIDFPNKKPTGRFCNGKNAADWLGQYSVIYIIYMYSPSTSLPFISLLILFSPLTPENSCQL